MRFHLIDRIDTFCSGEYITAVKCVSLADDVFNEHFPGYPIFPGSLIIEALAQLGGSLFELTMQREQKTGLCAILSIVNQFKLRRPVRPGDRMLLRADLVSRREDYGVVKVVAEVDGELCATGELTFSFVPTPHEKITASRQELYTICTKHMLEVQFAK
jgi:3-hydroxyacyl-[acyl-carrier-protein] dehydratase